MTPWLLARLGASVVRVPPAGDAGDPAYRVAEAVLDGGVGADRDRLLGLVAMADVVVETGPPTATTAWGLDEGDLVGATPAWSTSWSAPSEPMVPGPANRPAP